MGDAETAYTAAEIANAAGRSPRWARRQFADVAPEAVAADGARAWLWTAFPIGVRGLIARRSRKLGFEDPRLALRQVRECPREATPRVADASAAAIARACAIRGVLSPILSRSRPGSLTSQVTDALRGCAVNPLLSGTSDRSVRRWITTALRRDRGVGDFEQLSLYLADRAPKLGGLGDCQADPLADPVFSVPATDQRLSPQSEGLVWNDAFEAWEQGGKSRHAKRSLVASIWRQYPAIASSHGALKRAFGRNFSKWSAAPVGERLAALQDGRSGNGREGIAVPEATVALIATRAMYSCEGRIAQAWYELWHEKNLPAEFYERLKAPVGLRKSEMPKRIRDLVSPKIAALRHVDGTKKERTERLTLKLDWDGIPAGCQVLSDDCTLPVKFYIETGESPSGYAIRRGQWLPWIDGRSMFWICGELWPTEQYTQEMIVLGLLKLHDTYGLPPNLKVERGTWKDSLMVKGRPNPLPWENRVRGLRDLGVAISHALTPQAKGRIEKFFDLVQSMMAGERGFCGRKERYDCPPHVAEWESQVMSGKAHPGQFFLHYKEWAGSDGRLEAIRDRYNNTPQAGSLNGLTPKEAFQKFYGAPPVRLEGPLRYLISTHWREVTVRHASVSFKIGNRPRTFAHRDLWDVEGKKVWLFWDIAEERFATVRLPDGALVLATMPPAIPAVGATREALRDAMAFVNRINRVPHEMAKRFRAEFLDEFANRLVRPVVASEADVRTGQDLERQKSDFREQEARDKTLTSRADRLLSGIGANVPRLGRAEDRVALVESLAQLRKMDVPEREAQR